MKTKGERGDLAAGSDEAWNPVQQKALEKALKLFPKGTDQRWDKIARAVPEKGKVVVVVVMMITVCVCVCVYLFI